MNFSMYGPRFDPCLEYPIMVTGSIANFVVNITYNFCCKEIYKVRIKLNIHHIKKKGQNLMGRSGLAYIQIKNE